MNKIYIIAIVCLAVLACVFAIWKLHSPAAAPTPSTDTTYTPVDEKTALAQLQADMQNVTPHVIANNEGGGHASFTPEEQKIRDDLVALYAARYAATSPSSPASAWLVTAQNGIWLNAIGQRYLLVTEANVKSAIDEIFDVQTGQVMPISGSNKLRYYLTPDRDVALYIDIKRLALPWQAHS